MHSYEVFMKSARKKALTKPVSQTLMVGDLIPKLLETMQRLIGGTKLDPKLLEREKAIITNTLLAGPNVKSRPAKEFFNDFTMISDGAIASAKAAPAFIQLIMTNIGLAHIWTKPEMIAPLISPETMMTVLSDGIYKNESLFSLLSKDYKGCEFILKHLEHHNYHLSAATVFHVNPITKKSAVDYLLQYALFYPILNHLKDPVNTLASQKGFENIISIMKIEQSRHAASLAQHEKNKTLPSAEAFKSYRVQDFVTFCRGRFEQTHYKADHISRWRNIIADMLNEISESYNADVFGSELYRSIYDYFGVRRNEKESFLSDAIVLMASTREGLDVLVDVEEFKCASKLLYSCVFKGWFYTGQTLGHVIEEYKRKRKNEENLKDAIIAKSVTSVSSLLQLNSYDEEISARMNFYLGIPHKSLIDVNAYWQKESKSMIDYAIESQDEEIVNLLLARNVGLDRNWNAKGIYPLHRAALFTNVAITAAIHKACPEILSQPNNDGDTPMHWIARRQPEKLELFVTNFSQMNLYDKTGESVLSLWLKSEFKNDPSSIFKPIPAEMNQTLLHIACINDDVKAITFLLSRGADVNVIDDNGKTPMDLISNKSKFTIRQVFKKYELLFTYQEVERYALTTDEQRYDEAYWKALCEKVFGFDFNDSLSMKVECYRYHFLISCSNMLNRLTIQYTIAIKLGLLERHMPVLNTLEHGLTPEFGLSMKVTMIADLIILAISKDRPIGTIAVLHDALMNSAGNEELKHVIKSEMFSSAAKISRTDILIYMANSYSLMKIDAVLFSVLLFKNIKLGNAAAIEVLIKHLTKDDYNMIIKRPEGRSMKTESFSIFGYSIWSLQYEICKIISIKFPEVLTEPVIKEYYYDQRDIDRNPNLLRYLSKTDDVHPLLLLLNLAGAFSHHQRSDQSVFEMRHEKKVIINKMTALVLSSHIEQKIHTIKTKECDEMPINELYLMASIAHIRQAIMLGLDFSTGSLGDRFHVHESQFAFELFLELYGIEKFKAMANRRSVFGRYALHNLYANKLLSLATFLIKHGADVEVKNSEGKTILMLAIENGDVRNVEILLNVINEVDISYVFNAIATGNVELYNLVKRHCANAKNCTMTLFDHAITNGNVEMVNALITDHPGYLLDAKIYEALIVKAKRAGKLSVQQCLKTALSQQKQTFDLNTDKNTSKPAAGSKAKKQVKIPSIQSVTTTPALTKASLSPHSTSASLARAKVVDMSEWPNYLKKMFCHAISDQQLVESSIDGKKCFTIELTDDELWKDIMPPKAFSDKKINIIVSNEQRQRVLTIIKDYLIDNRVANVIVKPDFIQIIPTTGIIPHLGILHAQVFKALGGEKALQSPVTAKSIDREPAKILQQVNADPAEAANAEDEKLNRKKRRELSKQQPADLEALKEMVSQFNGMLDATAKTLLSNFQADKMLKVATVINSGKGLRLEFDLQYKGAYKGNTADITFYLPKDVMTSLVLAMNKVAKAVSPDSGALIECETNDKTMVMLVDFNCVSMPALLLVSDLMIEHFSVKATKIYHKANDVKLESTKLEDLINLITVTKQEKRTKRSDKATAVGRFTLFSQLPINDQNRQLYLSALSAIDPLAVQSAEKDIDYLKLLINGMRLFHLAAIIYEDKDDMRLSNVYYHARLLLRHAFDYHDNWADLYALVKPFIDGLKRDRPSDIELAQFENALLPYKAEIDAHTLGKKRARVRFNNIPSYRVFIEEVQTSELAYEIKRDITLMLLTLIDEAIFNAPAKLRSKSNEVPLLTSWIVGHKGHYKSWNDYADEVYVALNYPSREDEEKLQQYKHKRTS